MLLLALCCCIITRPQSMTQPVAIHEDEIIRMVSMHPDGIAIGSLEEAIAVRFGRFTTYYTGSAAGLDLNGLLDLLDTRGKLHISRGVIHQVESQRKAG